MTAERTYLSIAVGLTLVVIVVLAVMVSSDRGNPGLDRCLSEAENDSQTNLCQRASECLAEAENDDDITTCTMAVALREEILPRTYECFDEYGPESPLCTDVMQDELEVTP